VADRYRDDGITLLRTDQMGAIFANVNRDGTLRLSTFDDGSLDAHLH
jgi:hypothetical protein